MTAPLPDVQRLFWKLLVAPEGVAKGIAVLEGEGEPAGRDVEAWFLGDERLDARGRLDVYANMYFFRIRDVVAEDFPALAKLLGPARWHNLMTDYLLVHPSTHWSLRYAGSRMAEFLEGHPLTRELPELPDLARLEWALADVFQQRDVPPFPRAALAAVSPERWPSLRFAAAPSVALLDLAFDVGPLREAVDACEGEERDADVPRAEARPTTFLVWREDEIARHEALEPADATALRALLSGETFEAVCGRLAEEGGDESAAAGAVVEILTGALSRGLLAGFSLEP